MVRGRASLSDWPLRPPPSALSPHLSRTGRSPAALGGLGAQQGPPAEPLSVCKALRGLHGLGAGLGPGSCTVGAWDPPHHPLPAGRGATGRRGPPGVAWSMSAGQGIGGQFHEIQAFREAQPLSWALGSG